MLFGFSKVSSLWIRTSSIEEGMKQT